MYVEATQMTGDGKLTLTGQLGDVMKESATLAMNWLRSNARRVSRLYLCLKLGDSYLCIVSSAKRLIIYRYMSVVIKGMMEDFKSLHLDEEYALFCGKWIRLIKFE